VPKLGTRASMIVNLDSVLQVVYSTVVRDSVPGWGGPRCGGSGAEERGDGSWFPEAPATGVAAKQSREE
jgi:hypothetical protein